MEKENIDVFKFTGSEYSMHRKFWEEHSQALNNFFQLRLFGDIGIEKNEIKSFSFNLSNESNRVIKDLSKENKLARFVVILSAFFIIARRYSQETCITLETPLIKQIDIEGNFNNLPINLWLDNGTTVIQTLNLVKEKLSKACKFQDYPFCLDHLGETFSNILIYSNELHNQPVSPVRYDIIICINDNIENGIRVDFTYSSRFCLDAIKVLINHFENIVNSLLDFDHLIDNIDYLGAVEKEFVLRKVNQTSDFFPKDKTLLDLFLDQVRLFPDQVCLEYKEKSLTYREIDQKSDQLAKFLQSKFKVQQDNIVALCMKRSDFMIITILSIFKCGAAYLPIDPDYPLERKEFIIGDSKAKLIILDEVSLDVLYSIPMFSPKTLIKEDSLYNDKFQIRESLAPDSIAYVMYTSGSTGVPKGVLIRHNSVVNRIFWMWKHYEFDQTDIVLQKTAYTFDVSIWEIFLPLSFGCKFIICDDETVKDPSLLLKEIEDKKVTSIHFVPSMLSLFLNVLKKESNNQSLKRVFSSGEELPIWMVKRFYEEFSIPLHNLYGPTEATVDVSFYQTSPNDVIVPIGKPIDNISLYIVDKMLNLTGVGVIGEIAISGIGLAKEYIGNKKLNSEKFRPNPYGDYEKLYLTGDLGYRLKTGDIVYCGRIDNQVKIAGKRIEIGEIEESIRDFGGIDDVIVVVKSDTFGDKKLYAFFTSKLQIEVHLIYNFLKKRIPSYLIPRCIVQLVEIPINRSGKVDRNLLSEMVEEEIKGEDRILRSGTESVISEIWNEILGQHPTFGKDDFFLLGGDSIKAIRVVEALNRVLSVRLEVKDIYENPKINVLANFIDELDAVQNKDVGIFSEDWKNELREREERKQLNQSDSRIKQKHFPISDIQSGILFHSLLDTENAIFHDQLPYQFVDKKFSLKSFNNAVQLLVKKHEILRVSFDLENYTNPTQIVHDTVQLRTKVVYDDLVALSNSEQKRFLLQFLKNDRDNKFDIKEPGLWRIYLFRVRLNEYLVIWVCHHAIMDGWSNASFMTELANTYQICKTSFMDGLPPLSITYKDYVFEQIGLVNSLDLKSYWKNKLVGFERTPLPFNILTKEILHTSDIAKFHFTVSHELVENIKIKCNDLALSNKEVLFAAFCHLIWVSTNSNDVTVGLVSHARPQKRDGDKVLGCFLNTIPFRFDISGKPSNKDFVKHVATLYREMKGFDKLSLKEIAKLSYGDEQIENPFFDIMFNYVDFHIYENLDKHIIKCNPIIDSFEPTNTLFDFNVRNEQNGIEIEICYREDLYLVDEIKRISAYYQKIISCFVSDWDGLLSSEIVLDDNERKQLLYDFNRPEYQFINNESITDIFSRIVELNPNRVAICNGIDELSYQELNRKSDTIRNFILSQDNLMEEEPIALIADKSLESIISMLGILKAGYPYLPIDPKLPLERVRFILNDANVKIVFSENALDINSIDGINVYSICDTLGNKLYESNISFENRTINNSLKRLIYIIYTSGSTGVPKGVMIEGMGFTNMIKDHISRFKINCDDNILQFASLAFDAAEMDIFLALLTGAKLTLLPSVILEDKYKFQEFLKRLNITGVCIPPTFLNILDHQSLSCLRFVISAGEPIIDKDAKQIAEVTECFNIYGPTEATVNTTVYRVEGNENLIPIGKPISNVSIYILNDLYQLVPRGVKGQICIAGDCLARGYVGNEDLSIRKFIVHPILNERLYLTGDMGVYDSSGNIFFQGRIDNQVKIRGFRIELGEIEQILLQHKNIINAKVSVINYNNSKELIAYVIPEEEFKELEVKDFLECHLPGYMIPDHFFIANRFPYTINKKVDFKSLEESWRSLKSKKNKVSFEPLSAHQHILIKACEKIFATDQITLTDNFFSLGGDSIKAIQLTALLKQHNIKLDVRTIFMQPILFDLSNKLIDHIHYEDTPIITGPIPLTPIQEEYFFNEKIMRQTTFNLSILLNTTKKLNRDRVQTVFQEIIKYHDSLRIKFEKDKGSIKQINQGEEVVKFFNVQEVKICSSLYEEIGRIQKSIRIFDDFLFKAVLVQDSGCQMLFLSASHLIIDVYSWRIILEDFCFLYENLEKGLNYNLPRKGTSFMKWSNALRRYGNIVYNSNEKEWWISVCKLKNSKLLNYEIKKDYAVRYKKRIHQFADESISVIINSFDLFGVEIIDVLITALKLSVNEVFRLDSFFVELEGHGREEIEKLIDISRTVGWFTATYPFHLRIENPNDVLDELQSVQKARKAIPLSGIGYGLLKLKNEDVELQTQLKVDCEISFNYLGAFKSVNSKEFLAVDYEFQTNMTQLKRSKVRDIDIVCYFKDSNLLFEIQYNSVIELSMMVKLADNFSKNLSRIVFALNKEMPSSSEQNLRIKRISKKTLDQINNLF